MATATLKQKCLFGRASNGVRMTPREFDRAEFVEGWRNELVNGVLIVNSTPSRNERDPNDELGHLLRVYRNTHPQGATLDATLNEETVATGSNRRRADRVIWTGLGRLPRRKDVPSIIAELVSAGKRNWLRDYEAKRDEYLAIGVKEYWVFNRFERTLTVFSLRGKKLRRRVVHENERHTSDLLPGFEPPLTQLFKLADRWPSEDSPE
jgi:Uma2 family endonuclease